MSLPKDHSASHRLVDHFFRHEYGRLLGRLARVLGDRNWEVAEDSVQAAMHEALRTWGPRGIPSDPGGWLYRVAHRKAIDHLRRTKLHQKFLDHEGIGMYQLDSRDLLVNENDQDTSIRDDRLRMLFLCCDPAISIDSQLALTLKLSAGFSVSEISRALLVSETTIQKRITRARENLRESSRNLNRFEDLDWAERVPSVLHTIYLIFNEGYFSFTTDHLLRKDLCDEAIRLGVLLDSTGFGCTPQTSALIALMLFHSSRFQSRQSDTDHFVSLEDQDRSCWDWTIIRRAMAWMQRSARGATLSRYHIEASIAWEHCRAAQFEQTDWYRIGELYQRMLDSKHSVYCQIGLAMAEFFTLGPAASISRLNLCLGEASKVGSLDQSKIGLCMTRQEAAACETLKGWVYLRIKDIPKAIESLRSAMKFSVGPNQTTAIKQVLVRHNLNPDVLES